MWIADRLAERVIYEIETKFVDNDIRPIMFETAARPADV
jgi:hypothetical protein